jgi:hypothetical protein
MADTNQKEGENYSDAETAARAEATLKRMLATPHKPHKNKGEAKHAPNNPSKPL